MKKQYITYALLIIAVLTIIVNLFAMPFWGNPLLKVKYYIQAQSYLWKTYQYHTRVTEVYYSFKEKDYTVYAKAKEFPDVTFSVVIEKNNIYDTLCDDVLGEQLRSEMEQTVIHSYGDYKYIHAYVSCGGLVYTKIPNYFEMLESGLINGAKVMVSVKMNFDNKSQPEALFNLYTVFIKAKQTGVTEFQFIFNPNEYKLDVSGTDFGSIPFIRPTTFYIAGGDFNRVTKPSDLLKFKGEQSPGTPAF